MDILNVKDFLKSVGIVPMKYDDFLPELIKATGSELAAEEIIFEIGNRHESTLLDEQKIYRLKNKTLAIAQVVNSYYDYNHYFSALKRIKKNKDVFGKEILEVGCDIGVITCYVALLCPDSKIKGIDLCPEGIMCAKELAAKLNISNIEFECIKLQDMNTKNKYDTLLTLKTTSENMNRQGGYNQCMTLDEGGDFVKSRIEKYISELSCFVRDVGNIYSIERRSVPEFAWGYVKAMNANGLVIEPNIASRYIFMEHEDTNTAMFSFVFTKKGSVNLEDLYLLYNKSFLNEWSFKQPQYTGENAALITQNSIRKVLFAYDVKNRYMEPITRLMVFTTDDPTAIAIYHYTINEEGENFMVVYNYDISVKDEVLADCKRTISNYKKHGFITKPIKFKPKFCKAQPFPDIIQFVPIE